MANEKRLIDANAPMIKEHFNPRLIDFREFVKECNHFYENPPFSHPATPWHKGLQLAIEIAMRLKPVDAVEVVHGRWEDEHGGKYANPRYRCSVCKERALYKFERDLLDNWKEVQALTPHCPFCTAKLDGGKGNDI